VRVPVVGDDAEGVPLGERGAADAAEQAAIDAALEGYDGSVAGPRGDRDRHAPHGEPWQQGEEGDGGSEPELLPLHEGGAGDGEPPAVVRGGGRRVVAGGEHDEDPQQRERSPAGEPVRALEHVVVQVAHKRERGHAREREQAQYGRRHADDLSWRRHVDVAVLLESLHQRVHQPRQRRHGAATVHAAERLQDRGHSGLDDDRHPRPAEERDGEPEHDPEHRLGAAQRERQYVAHGEDGGMRPGVRKVSRRSGEHEAHRVQRDAQDEEALVHGEQALVEQYDTQPPRARGRRRRLRRRWNVRLHSRPHIIDSQS